MNYKIFLTLSFLISSLSIYGQSMIKVTGSIMDQDENPIASAQIYVDMKRIKAKSNKKGDFKIKVERGTKLITVFHPDHGYINQDYSRKRKMDFVFANNSRSLDLEEFEALGYDSEIQPKRRQQNYASFTDVYEILDQTFPQVRVINSQIFIGRGGPNSVSTTQDPLILVEGVQTPPSSLGTIPTQDIKSIRVIHKGSEAAFYGLRGQNGVILISLKTGEEEDQ